MQIESANNMLIPRKLPEHIRELCTFFPDRPTETNLINTGDDEHYLGKTMMSNWRNLDWKK
jgi:hypothetical protein